MGWSMIKRIVVELNGAVCNCGRPVWGLGLVYDRKIGNVAVKTECGSCGTSLEQDDRTLVVHFLRPKNNNDRLAPTRSKCP